MASAEDHVRYAFVGQVMDEAIKVCTEDVAFGFLFLAREVLKLEAAQALPESYYAGATSRILAFVTMRHYIWRWETTIAQY
jgi:hypothetical protein